MTDKTSLALSVIAPCVLIALVTIGGALASVRYGSLRYALAVAMRVTGRPVLRLSLRLYRRLVKAGGPGA
jgi:hypothetical protein